jgi:Protein of unknown function (DUF1573)
MCENVGRNSWSVLFICVVGLSACVMSLAREASESEKIKLRVAQYYDAVQSSQQAKVAEFLVPKARGSFFPQFDPKLVGTRAVDVKIEEGGNSAVVKIISQVMVPTAMRPVDVPSLVRWKKEAGEWLYDPQDPPRTRASIFKEYYWAKQAARARKDPKAPPIEVKFDKDEVDFGVAVQGTPVNLKFSFTNLSSKDLVIEQLYLHEELMRDLTSERVIKPGKKGEILFTLETGPLYREFEHDVFVQFEPIKEIVKLKVKGKVFTAKEIADSLKPAK